jgi:DNA-binding PadR family transcriptional regulator
MHRLTKAECSILERIAKYGEKTDYDLSEKDKVAADSTVWKALRNLEKLDLIEIKREEPFRIPGKNKKYYGLTFRGIIASIKMGVHLNIIQEREKLVTKWIQKARDIDNELKISRLFNLTSKTKEKRLEILRNMLSENMKEASEELEKFLSHFDLDFSSNILIIQEWLWYLSLHTLANHVQTA